MLIGIDRFMSEARALTSLASNAVATIAIAISEKACDRQVLLDTLDGKLSSPVVASNDEASWQGSKAAGHH